MLIRTPQMDAFAADARRRFHQRLSTIIRSRLPRLVRRLDDAEMLLRISAADAKAATYGIVSERGIGQFVMLTFLAGPNFDDIPKVHRYLTYPRVEPHHRIETLFDYFVDRVSGMEGN